MPCNDYRDDPATSYADGLATGKRDARHNSDVAELLCYVLTKLDGAPSAKLFWGNPALAQWWKEHQERDRLKAEKEAKEQADKAARKAYERDLRLLKQKHGIKE